MSGTAEPALRITPFHSGASIASATLPTGSKVSHFVRLSGQRFRHSRCRNAPYGDSQTATGSAGATATASFFTERSAKKAPVGSTDITRIQASRLPVHLRRVWPYAVIMT
jgi:hypothetical protein